MMKSIVEEKLVSFKTLEQNIFSFFCEQAREMTRILLENYDAELAAARDRSRYRNKGLRTTVMKTVYGEVSYSRRVYQTTLPDGKNACVYLLDKAMQMNRIGLLSTNLVEKIAMTVTETPYRTAAEIINSTCGQSISHGGVWNLIQKLGERIRKEEDFAVKQMEAGQAEGKEAVPVLFEEMDGVWLSMQDSRHRKMKKQEMKVFTMYEGWDGTNKNRSCLVNKTVFAGMDNSREFHAKREAIIENRYAVDEIGQRVLNGDGGSWIREPCDPEAIFQLDRYHICQEIVRKISDKEARKEVRRLFDEEKMDEMLDYIRTYSVSVASFDEKDKRSKKAQELYTYLNNNRDGLMPYQKRGIQLPEAPDGIVYKTMGVQENQNCTLITRRMKHRRMRWSVKGADNMAKALYRKENCELTETIERYTDGLIFASRIKEILPVLSAAKAPKKDGKGNPYVDKISCHMPLLDAIQTASRKAFRNAFCH